MRQDKQLRDFKSQKISALYEVQIKLGKSFLSEKRYDSYHMNFRNEIRCKTCPSCSFYIVSNVHLDKVQR